MSSLKTTLLCKECPRLGARAAFVDCGVRFGCCSTLSDSTLKPGGQPQRHRIWSDRRAWFLSRMCVGRGRLRAVNGRAQCLEGPPWIEVDILVVD